MKHSTRLALSLLFTLGTGCGGPPDALDETTDHLGAGYSGICSATARADQQWTVTAPGVHRRFREGMKAAVDACLAVELEACPGIFSITDRNAETYETNPQCIKFKKFGVTLATYNYVTVRAYDHATYRCTTFEDRELEDVTTDTQRSWLENEEYCDHCESCEEVEIEDESELPSEEGE